MSARTRNRKPSDGEAREPDEVFAYEAAYGLDDDITDDDIADFLHAKEAEEEKPGIWNLPTIAGLSTITVGSAYLLQELGLFASGFDFSALVGPWLIGVLIILLGFGVLSWSPDRKRRKQKQRERAARRRARAQAGRTASRRERKQDRRERKTERRSDRRARYERRRGRFAKSRTNRKLFGVAGGIGEALGIDPTLVRIAFVIALIAGSGAAIPIYLLLAWLMPDAKSTASAISDRDLDDDRMIIIR
ncbi:MAG: PspC domain-containing protein [Bacteroidota bacterium]